MASRQTKQCRHAGHFGQRLFACSTETQNARPRVHVARPLNLFPQPRGTIGIGGGDVVSEQHVEAGPEVEKDVQNVDISTRENQDQASSSLAIVPIKYELACCPGLRRVSVNYPPKLTDLLQKIAQSFPQHSSILLNPHHSPRIIVSQFAYSRPRSRRGRLKKHRKQQQFLHNSLETANAKICAMTICKHPRADSTHHAKRSKSRCRKKVVEIVVTDDAGLTAAFHRSKKAQKVLRFKLPQLPKRHACSLCQYTPNAKTARGRTRQLREHLAGKRHQYLAMKRDIRREKVRRQIVQLEIRELQLRDNPFGLKRAPNVVDEWY